MNFRSEFIDGLEDYFKAHLDRGDTEPIELQALNVQSDTPVNPESYNNARPALFLAYGDTNKVQGQELVGADYETFTVLVYAHVNAGDDPINNRKDRLVGRQGAMDTLIRQAVRFARANPPDADIFIENAYIGRATTDKGLLGRYAFMQFEIVFLYQSDIDM